MFEFCTTTIIHTLKQNNTMFIEQLRWNEENSAWSVQKLSTTTVQNIQLVLAFGGRKLIDHPEVYASLKGLYPSADIVFCSTSV